MFWGELLENYQKSTHDGRHSMNVHSISKLCQFPNCPEFFGGGKKKKKKRRKKRKKKKKKERKKERKKGSADPLTGKLVTLLSHRE
jgi:hypothetical protein